MDLLSVGLEAEDKGSGITVGKGLGIELNKRRTTWLSFAELGAALGDVGAAASWAALGASPGAAPGVALGTAPGAALGMVLERIEVEEGESLMPKN